MTGTKAQASPRHQRSQFTLRSMLIQLSLCGIAMALVATRRIEWIFLVPTVVVGSLLVATRGVTFRAALIGFVFGSIAWLLMMLTQLDWSRIALQDLGIGFLAYGSCGAWIGTAISGMRKGYRFIGGLALASFPLIVCGGAYFLIPSPQ